MNKIKIIVDIVMTCMMILLMKTNVTGLDAHEIIGLLIFILFIIHKVLNFKFIKAIGKNIFNKKLKFNSKIMFWLDVILLIFMTINVFSGILISRFIFSFINISNVETLTVIHKFFAWWTLILISIHIGFHLDRLSNYLKKKFNILKNKPVKVIVLLLYLVIATLGIISLTKYSIYSKLVPINRTAEISNKYVEEEQIEQEVIEEDKDNDKNNDEDEDEDEDVPTLDEYLSKFHCDGCRKQCSLLNPRCGVGRSKREEKIREYYEKYGNEQNKVEDIEQDVDNNINNKEVVVKKEQIKCKNKSTILDVVYIVILFVGASYYLNIYLNNKKIN